MSTRSFLAATTAILSILSLQAATFSPPTEKWQAPYSGKDMTGSHVLGYWTFDSATDLVGKSSHKSSLNYVGAKFHADGKDGGAIEGFPGWPVNDKKAAVTVKHLPALSPRGAFTAEMWIKPKTEFTLKLRGYLLDKKYVAHQDYQWIIGAEDGNQQRRLMVYLGFGSDTERFVSGPASYSTNDWSHVAFTYDGAGTVAFFYNGGLIGRDSKSNRGAIHPGNYELSIGDRRGSNYGGFPGYIDQVRLCEGIREFRPLGATHISERKVFVRMEAKPSLTVQIQNLKSTAVAGGTASLSGSGIEATEIKLPDLKPGATHDVTIPIDTSLRPDDYEIVIALKSPSDSNWRGHESFSFTIVPRPLPHRMPVLMWGFNSASGITKEMSRLKDLGFTHVLGARPEYHTIYTAEKPTTPAKPESMAAEKRMLDAALANDLRIVTSLSPGSWARSLKEFQRVDLKGKPYARHDVNGLHPKIQQFCENVGASMAQGFGKFPAFQGALIHSEVRGHSQVSFSELDRAAYRKATGKEIPAEVRIKNGVEWNKLKNFPTNRVIPDDDPILTYYKWFWKNGDGWNGLHSAVHRGFKSTGRPDLWTFHDPAVRTTTTYGSGGDVDFISQWTYSYPDPIRAGLDTDELFTMAKGAKHNQGVMKMTQIIWYRSQTAPMKKPGEATTGKTSPWEDQDPDAAYITISPMHLREAFWIKMARPIQGIMYHGWQSLVKTHPPGAYRYTHTETQHELKRLVEEIVEPLGPMLKQVPDRKSDIAFLESFASQMFARRGTFGWNHTWIGDAFHILQYAHLQTEVVYDETVIERGLDDFKVLCMFDCDVITEKVLARVKAFQKRGGIVIGDERLTPAIKPDIVIRSFRRTKKADADRAELVAKASKLRKSLDAKYTRFIDSSSPDVITRARRYGDTDYIFAINDRREFGSYVGQHGMVMENGLPANGEITIQRANGVVYELPSGRIVPTKTEAGRMKIPVDLGPGEGRVFVVAPKRIGSLTIDAPDPTKRSSTANCKITCPGASGAVIPVQVEILDPDGRAAEHSGHYGMKDGSLKLPLNIAPNDTPGLWQIRVTELLSHKESRAWFRVTR